MQDLDRRLHFRPTVAWQRNFLAPTAHDEQLVRALNIVLQQPHRIAPLLPQNPAAKFNFPRCRPRDLQL